MWMSTSLLPARATYCVYQERPTKVIACVGLGLCLARHHLCPEGSAAALRRRGKVRRQFHRFSATLHFLSRLNLHRYRLVD